MIKIPETTAYIIDKIEGNGFEAFAVGGCIRDSLLGRIPNDWDITTSAKPEDIINIFENTVETGIEHGTVSVIIDKVAYEVTTYRIDGDYTDGRHPDSVEFTTNIKEDLSRRDFTINAMAYNYSAGLVDKFGGREDLDRKIIKCVGNPRKRFEEDALRMMRGIRFSAQLGFSIENETFSAIKEMASLISAVSIERINVEFTKTLMSDASKIMLYHESGILKNIIPEIYIKRDSVDKSNENNYAINLIKMGVECANNCKRDLACRLAGFLVYINEEIGLSNTKKILKRMRYDNKNIEKACKLLEYSMKNISSDKEDLKLLLMKLDDIELFKDLVNLKRAEVKVYLKNRKELEEKSEDVAIEILEVFTEEALLVLDNTEKILEEIIEKNECFRIKDLDINGKDLIDMGIKPGKEIGETLNKILKEVIKNPALNKKEKLMDIVKNI